MKKTTWNIEASRALYNIEHWSGDYFDIAANGQVCAYPRGKATGQAVNLYALSETLQAQGLMLPILVRFTDILRHRIECLYAAFQHARQEEDYPADYTAIYPIKVNQQKPVVEAMLAQHNKHHIGLEAGSKPELMAVLALSPAGGTIICNGYKDREYIRLALIGLKLGLQVYLVVEKSSELKLIIEESRALGVSPNLGVRIRLASLGTGKWQNTGGEKAKFGLSSAQVLRMIEQLRQADMLDCLRLMHFHMGSQIANIRDIQRGLTEAARYYLQLHRLGAPLSLVDVGGGLGIDYDGTQSRSDCSINYSLQEYANNIVYAFADICKQHQLPHPHLLTEAGRAMSAHHAVLLTQVTDIEPALGMQPPQPAGAEEAALIRNLWEGLKNLNQRSLLETYHDAGYWLGEARSLFDHGLFDLHQRARAEELYFAICHRVLALLQPHNRSHRVILDELHDKLADKYFCNFSLFQSMPDAWGIDQVFPIMPLHRLDSRPQRRAKLQDLTCDSDGQFGRYVDAEGVETSLPVHACRAGEAYVLGIFLVGAYQEILGDMHNLFGDTHAVNVKLTADGYELDAPELGDSVEDMLRYVHFDVATLRRNYQQRLAAAQLSTDQAEAFAQALEAGLRGYTYLESSAGLPSSI